MSKHPDVTHFADSAVSSDAQRIPSEIRRTRGFELWAVMQRDKNGLFYPAHILGTRKQAREFIARMNSYPLLKRERYVQKYGPYR